jgi:predicted transcriptional regulator
MSDHVIFFRPVEKVGTVVDVLKSCPFLNFPIVDTEDSDLLYGTISSRHYNGRNSKTNNSTFSRAKGRASCL